MYSFASFIIACLCLCVFLLSTIGNILVISVIIRYKRLQNATNYILLSLAIADLTVTFCVMLPATIQDILGIWIWSMFFCKFYIALDITCCTASILHLLLVAIDRYIAIFNPLRYKEMIKKWHIFALVLGVWTLSFCMSFIPIFMGWNELSTNGLTANTTEPVVPNACYLESNVPYAIISSSLSFYIPLVVMSIVYLQIYLVAKRQAKEIAKLDFQPMNHIHHEPQSPNGDDHMKEKESVAKIESKMQHIGMVKSIKKIEKKRSKDKKAIKTLGIIMGIFSFCWLPFFLMYLLVPITQTQIPIFWERVITWIGYVNSFINPIVYALTNRDFRKAYIATLKVCDKCLRTQDDFNLNNTRQSSNFKQTSKRKQSWSKKFVCCAKENHTESKTASNRDLNRNSVGVKEQHQLAAVAPAPAVVSQLTSRQPTAATMITARPHNQVETEIMRLIDEQPYKILCIDEPSEFIASGEHYNNYHSSHHGKGKTNRSESAFELKEFKLTRQRNYLDKTDDEESNTDEEMRESFKRRSTSFSADVKQRPPKKDRASFNKKFFPVKQKPSTKNPMNQEENRRELPVNSKSNILEDEDTTGIVQPRATSTRRKSNKSIRNNLKEQSKTGLENDLSSVTGKENRGEEEESFSSQRNSNIKMLLNQRRQSNNKRKSSHANHTADDTTVPDRYSTPEPMNDTLYTNTERTRKTIVDSEAALYNKSIVIRI